MVAAEPSLLPHLFELDQPRMHLIALALAHLDAQALPEFGTALVRASASEILQHVLGRTPVGVRRALGRLPPTVLRRNSYRCLVELLDDPKIGKVLRHPPDTALTDSTIELLYQVPAPLRPVVIAVVNSVPGLDNFADGLRLLASRDAGATFDAMVADLAAQSQPGQFIARLKDLVAALPLPQTMPPAQIGMAHRLDTTAEVCAIAKSWKNCLADYMGDIDAGACAIYLWDDAIRAVACQVTRHGRLGWFLGDVLGPENADPAPHLLQQVRSAFARADIPDRSAAYAIECILELDCIPRSARR
jgi:hypothetical protein